MNIAVYCASSPGNAGVFLETARKLGIWIASHGHTVVYGGADVGLMGAVANAALAAGGDVIGVLPDTPRVQAVRHPGLTRYYEESSVSQRKAKMIELADAFVALPGGPGTLDEMAEVIALMKLGTLRKPCALVDVDGFYGPLRDMYGSMLASGFATSQELSYVLFSDDIEAIGAFIEAFAAE